MQLQNFYSEATIVSFLAAVRTTVVTARFFLLRHVMIVILQFFHCVFEVINNCIVSISPFIIFCSLLLFISMF